jgi:hypothetical protein
MKIKFLGKWYEIQCFNITKNDGTAFITKDYESSIDDVEINGLHLAESIGRLNNEVSKSEAVEPQDNKPTEKVGKEDNFPTKNGKFRVGDEVMTIDLYGGIFRGKIAKIYGVGLCQLVTPDGKSKLIDIPLSNLVDNSDDADFNYKQAQIRKKQAEYWEKKALANIGNAIDWEQRTYDLAAQIYVKRQYSTQGCYNDAKAFVDEYRKEAKL